MFRRLFTLTLAFSLILATANSTEIQAARNENYNDTIRGADKREYSTNAKGAVVLEAHTGRVLFAQNADSHLAMASTTKIMTALLALEQEDLDTYFTVDAKAIHVEGSSMGLREGDSVSLSTLAYGMLLPSGNDAANAAAVRIAGSKEAFAELMNERADELGLLDTHFVTPSGLDDDKHYSTPYDMAILARAALDNPRFAEICSKSKAKVQFGNPPYDRWLSNHNRLLTGYEGAVGVKTGFTDSAGRCLVSCAQRDGIRLIVVTLNCPDDWNEHKKLYDRYFSSLHTEDPERYVQRIKVPVTGGTLGMVDAVFDEAEDVALLEDEKLTTVTTIEPILFAPVRRRQVIGKVSVYCDSVLLEEITLMSGREVPSVTLEKETFFDWLCRIF